MKYEHPFSIFHFFVNTRKSKNPFRIPVFNFRYKWKLKKNEKWSGAWSVFALLDVEKYRDLEIRVRGH